MTQTFLSDQLPVDLRDVLNERGITSRADLARGGLNVWGNSLPEEQLSSPGTLTPVGRIRFIFPARGKDGSDHVRCLGQHIPVTRGRYDWIHILAVAERRSEDTIALFFHREIVEPPDVGRRHVEFVALQVSDFWPETAPWFGERDGISFDALHYPRHVEPRMAPTVWRTRVPVAREAQLDAITLPDNPAIHIFAMTLIRSDSEG